MDEKDLKRFNEVDEKGRYSTLQLRKTGNADTKEERPNMFFQVTAPDGSKVYPFGPTGYLSRWRVSRDSYAKLVEDNMIVWKKSDSFEPVTTEGYEKSPWTPYVKYYLEGRTKQVSNLFQDIEGNKKASIVLKDLLGSKGIFDNPKPVEFLRILFKFQQIQMIIFWTFFLVLVQQRTQQLIILQRLMKKENSLWFSCRKKQMKKAKPTKQDIKIFVK